MRPSTKENSVSNTQTRMGRRLCAWSTLLFISLARIPSPPLLRWFATLLSLVLLRELRDRLLKPKRLDWHLRRQFQSRQEFASLRTWKLPARHFACLGCRHLTTSAKVDWRTAGLNPIVLFANVLMAARPLRPEAHNQCYVMLHNRSSNCDCLRLHASRATAIDSKSLLAEG